jgi:hypothetical protein
MVDLLVRRRTLLEFNDPLARVGATGVAGMGVRMVPTLPWETWGPTNSRILDYDSPTGGCLCGERRAMVLMSRITMQDYNPYRVRRALALLGGAGREVTLACGSMVKVVKEASVYRGGESFLNDIETNLPYVETVTSYDGCHDIYMDENYLVATVPTAVSHVHLRSSIKALSDERTLSRQVNETSICILCDTVLYHTSSWDHAAGRSSTRWAETFEGLAAVNRLRTDLGPIESITRPYGMLL